MDGGVLDGDRRRPALAFHASGPCRATGTGDIEAVDRHRRRCCRAVDPDGGNGRKGRHGRLRGRAAARRSDDGQWPDRRRRGGQVDCSIIRTAGADDEVGLR